MTKSLQIFFEKEWKEWQEYWQDVYQYTEIFLVRFFSLTTFIKKITSSLMYRQQGRFSGLFLHSGMAIFSIVVILFSPTIEAVLATRSAPRGDYEPVVNLIETNASSYETQISDTNKGEITEYRVQDGDTVASIAQTFGVSIDTILWENNLKNADSLKPKQVIRILPVTGVRHQVKRGETIYSIAKSYQIDPQLIVDYPYNTFLNDETFALAVGQEIFLQEGIKPNVIPVDRPRPALAFEVPPQPGIKGEGSFIWPSYGTITQRYGAFHTGIDLANRTSPPIVASQGGTVVKSGWNAGGYGNYAIVDHGNSFRTLYAHMVTGSLAVKAGDVVKQGQRLGQMGTTGRSTGIHLHFEVFKDNSRLNPLSVLPKI